MQDRLIPISLNHTMPKKWLDEIVPYEFKLLPSGYKESPFLLIENALSKKSLESIKKSLKKEERLGIISSKKLVTSPSLDSAIRNTFRMSYDEKMSLCLEGIFDDFRYRVGEFFNVTLIDRGKVQALGYQEGCFYKRHSDNCSEVYDRDGDLISFKPVAIDRKITTVLFLNTQGQDFEGGEFMFDFIFDENGKNVVIKPEEGMFVAFPSNPYFTHTISEVTSGFRISLVKWWNAMVF